VRERDEVKQGAVMVEEVRSLSASKVPPVGGRAAAALRV